MRHNHISILCFEQEFSPNIEEQERQILCSRGNTKQFAIKITPLFIILRFFTAVKMVTNPDVNRKRNASIVLLYGTVSLSLI